MAIITIRMLPRPNYFGTKALDGNKYIFTFRWNSGNSKKYLRIRGVTNDVDLKSIAVLPGKNLLEQHGYGDILGELWCVDESGLDEDPTLAGMGGRWKLKYTELPVYTPSTVVGGGFEDVGIWVYIDLNDGGYNGPLKDAVIAYINGLTIGATIEYSVLLAMAESFEPENVRTLKIGLTGARDYMIEDDIELDLNEDPFTDEEKVEFGVS